MKTGLYRNYAHHALIQVLQGAETVDGYQQMNSFINTFKGFKDLFLTFLRNSVSLHLMFNQKTYSP